MGHEFHPFLALYGFEFDSVDSQDSHLGGIQYRRKGLDSQSAKIGYGKGSAGKFIGIDVSVDAGLSKPFCFRRRWP